ncbi:cytosine permease [Corynebacterium lehmanniae]
METLGIDIVPESERTAKPSDLFWPWFAANISVFGISYGSFVLWFGLSFWQGALVTALGVTFSFFLCGLIAADWSRYQRRDTPDSAIIFWNTFGGAIAPAILVVFGLLLAASDEALAEAIADDPIGALAVVLPTWVLVPFLITAVLALVSGAVLGIYSSGLTLLTLGINIPRPAAAAIDGVILTLGTIWVVFFAESFLGPFQSFLITLGVPLASWAGILIADIYSRTQDYDEPSLYDAKGRYGAIDWTSICILVVSSVIGWGLVANMFAEEAAWNNWQGYLLPLVGEHWADANLGVLVALVLSFVAAWFARRGRIRRQEGSAA